MITRFMKVVAVMCAATLLASIAAQAQGYFVFINRAGSEIDARFVLSTDPPGTSSVGSENFQVELLAGPQGAPLSELAPTIPLGTTFRAPAGSVAAGYVNATTAEVPSLHFGSPATILVRAFDGPSWDQATYRFQGSYDMSLGHWNATPYLNLGTSALVLEPVPEPPSGLLVVLGLAAVTVYFRKNEPLAGRIGVMTATARVARWQAGLADARSSNLEGWRARSR